ncbi:hypothetical protein WMY93_016737 [Mugilogobius chulae]|uniref:Caspase recruitment domain-containing protein n=1 Tax=Mugilogobius chulae TaxID=88201 RepID=A0AAW0NR13_9GOBI
MSYASDKLYNGYLRKHMPRIETIEAKRETYGNYNAMVLLLDCLRRREDWPEEFITALEECEHWQIAAEIRAEYDALRSINTPSHAPPPAPPAANVVTAHVHPAPSPVQEVQSATPVTQPIQETEKPAPQSTPALAAAPVIELTTPPEQPKEVVVPPVTPPPSPDLVRASANPSPPMEQVNIISHQEPEENLEPEPLQAQDVPQEEVHVHQAAEELLSTKSAEFQVEPCEIDDPTLMASNLNTIVNENTPIIDTVIKPIGAEPEPVSAVVEDNTNTVEEDALTQAIWTILSVSPVTTLDDVILTPEKPPVQETSPAGEKAPFVFSVLEKNPEPQNEQVVETSQNIEVPPSPSAELENGRISAPRGSVSEDDDICFSKPGVLMSVAPQIKTTQLSVFQALHTLETPVA